MFLRSIFAFFITLLIPISTYAQVKILSFDGGGIRGIASLEILKRLEKDSGILAHEEFDVFAGTSTGSIIAVTLAMGIPIQEMIHHYEELSSDVFGHKALLSLFHPKYDRKRLEKDLLKIFKKHGYSKSTKLGDLPKKVVIPIVRLDDPHTHRWAMGVLENITEQGKGIRAIDAIMESTAAPTYFPSSHHAVDGGMAAKDPSLVAYTYAYHPYHVDRDGATVLSIGTGYTDSHIKKEEDWGVSQWLSPINAKGEHQSPPILSMIQDVESEMPQEMVSILLPKAYRRIDFPLESAIGLDDYRDMNKLIKETNDYLNQHPTFWKQTCQWLKNQMK